MAGIWDDLKLQYKLGGPEHRLIYVNVAVFIVSLVFFYDAQARPTRFDYPVWLALSPDWNTVLRHPWTLLSYAFFHGSFFHLLFNMMVLNFSGRLFRTFFTAKQFIGAYLLGAIFAGLVFVAGYVLLGRANLLVGASAAIMTILIAAATYQPDMRIRLMLVGNIQLWHLAAVILGIDMLYLFAENTGGHISHLAGALFGFAYIKLLQSGTDLSRPVTAVFDWFATLFAPRKNNFRKVHKNYGKKPAVAASRIVTKDKAQQQIDEILDKISRSGYDSLTKEEKDFLFRAGK